LDKLILEISKDLQEDPLLTTTWIERIKKEDGSYEIKAVFVPNLYGFFADLPYEYLFSIW
jgi:hypothetical protein